MATDDSLYEMMMICHLFLWLSIQRSNVPVNNKWGCSSITRTCKCKQKRNMFKYSQNSEFKKVTKRNVNVFKSFRRKLEDAMAQTRHKTWTTVWKLTPKTKTCPQASRVTRPRCPSLTEGPETTPTNRTGFIWAWHGPSRCFVPPRTAPVPQWVLYVGP